MLLKTRRRKGEGAWQSCEKGLYVCCFIWSRGGLGVVHLNNILWDLGEALGGVDRARNCQASTKAVASPCVCERIWTSQMQWKL